MKQKQMSKEHLGEREQLYIMILEEEPVFLENQAVLNKVI